MLQKDSNFYVLFIKYFPFPAGISFDFYFLPVNSHNQMLNSQYFMDFF